MLLGPLTPVELATARYVPAGLIAPRLSYRLVMRPLPTLKDFVRASLVAGVLFIATYAVLLNIGETTMAAGPAGASSSTRCLSSPP